MKKLRIFAYALLAGLFVSIGGIAFLSLDNKVIGALMFTVGLFTICTMGMNLFTGKVCYSLDNRPAYVIDLLIIWLGNLVGTWATAMLVRLTRIASVSEKAASMCQLKLDDSLLSIFILAIMCNILIFLAVDGYKNIKDDIGRYLALFFGVMVFILCGFEHCVANMFYISVAGMWSGKAVVFIIVNTLGNSVGGLLIPSIRKCFSEAVRV